VGGMKDYVTRAPLRKLTGVPKGSSRNVRHEQPIRHALLEMPDHGRLGSWDRDCQRLACGRSELNDVGAVILRPVDHDPVLAARRRHAHLRRSFDQSSSASRFTAGASSGQPYGSFGGSLCASSGHSLSTTARISSEMWSMRSISSMYLCRRFRSAGIITLP